MATQVYNVADFDNENVVINVLYDDQTLSISAVQFKNTTPFPASVTWNGHTETLPANTPLTSQSVTKLHESMVQITNARGLLVDVLPGGSVTCVWPA